jgi:HPr kinase/phosphorylase
MAPLSVDTLFEKHTHNLTLQWLAGENGKQRCICFETEQNVATIGYLNFVRPQQIQIIGFYELAYLEALPPHVGEDMLVRLFTNDKLVCVIIVDDVLVSPKIIDYADQYHVPLIASQLAGEKVINYLHETFSRLLAQRITLHGVFMDVLGVGVLITGDSGIGKSELALELVSRGHRLVADDAPEFIRVSPERVRGSSTCVGMEPFLEVRGLGILNVQALFGDSAVKKEKYLRLIVRLEPLTLERLKNAERLREEHNTRCVLEVDIPEICLPVAPGRNLAVLLECAVRNHSLQDQGYDAVKDFCQRQRRAMQEEQIAE